MPKRFAYKIKQEKEEKKFKKYTDMLETTSPKDLNTAISKIEDKGYRDELIVYLQKNYNLSLL